MKDYIIPFPCDQSKVDTHNKPQNEYEGGVDTLLLKEYIVGRLDTISIVNLGLLYQYVKRLK